MAEELGVAELKVVINDEEARAALGVLRREIESLNRQSSSSAGRLQTPSSGGSSITRDDVRRFNLRSFSRALEALNDDIQGFESASRLNLGTNWGIALNILNEVSDDLQNIASGKRLNIQSSWNQALSQLIEIDNDLSLLQGAQQLNLRSNWTKALQQLEDIDENIRAIQAGRQLNIASSWNKALAQLSEIDEDLRALQASEQLNLRSNWTKALATLTDIDQEIRAISAAERINLNAAWTRALTELSEIEEDLQSIQSANRLNLRSSWTKALSQLQETKEDIDFVAKSNKLNLRTSWQRFLGELQEVKRDIDQAAAQTIGGTLLAPTRRLQTNFKDLRQNLSALNNQLSNIVTSSVIGGAFPLLFGQGAGASIGGFTGGLLGSALGPGGGFAGSLFGTVIGQTADTFNKLALAIQKPVDALPQLIEGANLSGVGVENLAKTLIDLGRTAEAEALIRNDLSRTLNPTVFLAAAAAQDKYQRNIADLQTRLGSFLSGPANEFSNWVSDLAQRVVGVAGEGSRPSRERSLALRGLGAATGLGGIGLLGLAAPVGFALGGPVGLAAGLGLAAAGGGLLALGATQIGAAGAEEAQLASSKGLEKVLSNIREIESSRIAIQRQILSLKDDEVKNADEIAKLTLEATIAQINAQKERAKAKALASQTILSTEEVSALKAEFQALDLQIETAVKEFEKLQKTRPDTNSIGRLNAELQVASQALERVNVSIDSISFRSAVADVTSLEVALKESQGTVAGVKADFLSAGIAAGEFRQSFDNVQSVLQNLEQYRATLDIDSTDFKLATIDIIATRDELQKLDGQKAVIEAQFLTEGLQNGLAQFTQTNLQNLANSLQTALQNAPFGSEAFQGIRDASILAQQALEQASNKIQFAAVGVRDAGAALAAGGSQAAQAIGNASRELRNLLEGNFNLLNQNLRDQVLQNAFNKINFGIVDRNALQSPSDVFAAARLSEQLSGTTTSLDALRSSLDGLNNKDWRVDVDVNTGGSGNLTYLQKPNLG